MKSTANNEKGINNCWSNRLLSWAKQHYLVGTIFGIPLSQGSLSKMHQWFYRSLYPSYQSWWQFIQQPGVRCVDETSYRLDGVNYWLWVANSAEVCVMFLAPSRSSAEVKLLLGEDFKDILSSDCWSAYNLQAARAKQKCLAHIGRELKALATSNFASNRQFSEPVLPILDNARRAYADYQASKLTLEQLQNYRLLVEAQLAQVLDSPPAKGWAADAQTLAKWVQAVISKRLLGDWCGSRGCALDPGWRFLHPL